MIKKYKFQPLPVIKLIPNLITFTALLVGVTAIRYALNNKWEESLACVIIAALLDGVDGTVARMLNVFSPFGVEIDSLCDFANFGIVPAILMYLWLHNDFNFQSIVWGSALFYIGCLATRLARFNLSTKSSNKKFKYFFIGVPAPAAGILCLTPIMMDIKISNIFNINLKNYIIYIIFYFLIIAFLAASRIPTFSIKYIVIYNNDNFILGIFIPLSLVCNARGRCIIHYQHYCK